MRVILLALALFPAQERPHLPVSELKTTTLKRSARSRPQRGHLAVARDRSYRGFGVRISRVAEGSTAMEAGLLEGDIVVGLGEAVIGDYDELRAELRKTRPKEKRWVFIERDGKDLEFEVTLQTPFFGMTIWKKPEFRLAVVLIEFEDVRHNPAFPPRIFEEMLFSRGRYVDTNPSGERVYGSLADYYHENSYGKLKVTGRAFDWVRVDHPRDYFEKKSMGSRAYRTEFRAAAIEQVRAREGGDCFEPFDGVVLIYAGDQSHYRPRALWPHRASLRVGKKSFPYYLSSEGGAYLASIGVHVHEFGHMLGLPDQYGQRHATGVGKWCVMAIGHMGGGASRNHRPFHLCAWCKMRLGWATPVLVDPHENQWVRLGPIERDPTQMLRILARPNGSEYFLLENRQRIGFDSDLDADGLLIWRVSSRGVDLVEGHGLKKSNASLLETEEIPFPNAYNNAFTPRTTPTSKGRPGAREVWVAGIVERDGIITLKIDERGPVKTWKPKLGIFH